MPVHASAFPFCDTFPIVTVLTKCLLLTTSSSARLIDATVTSFFFSWYAVCCFSEKCYSQ